MYIWPKDNDDPLEGTMEFASCKKTDSIMRDDCIDTHAFEDNQIVCASFCGPEALRRPKQGSQQYT